MAYIDENCTVGLEKYFLYLEWSFASWWSRKRTLRYRNETTKCTEADNTIWKLMPEGSGRGNRERTEIVSWIQGWIIWISRLKARRGDPEEIGEDTFLEVHAQKKRTPWSCSMNGWERFKVRLGRGYREARVRPPPQENVLPAASFASSSSVWNASTCHSWIPHHLDIWDVKGVPSPPIPWGASFCYRLSIWHPARSSILLVLYNHDSSIFGNRQPLDMQETSRNPHAPLSRSWGLQQHSLRYQCSVSHSLEPCFVWPAPLPLMPHILAVTLYLPSSAFRMSVFGAVFTPGGLVGSFLNACHSGPSSSHFSNLLRTSHQCPLPCTQLNVPCDMSCGLSPSSKSLPRHPSSPDPVSTFAVLFGASLYVYCHLLLKYISLQRLPLTYFFFFF